MKGFSIVTISSEGSTLLIAFSIHGELKGNILEVTMEIDNYSVTENLFLSGKR